VASLRTLIIFGPPGKRRSGRSDTLRRVAIAARIGLICLVCASPVLVYMPVFDWMAPLEIARAATAGGGAAPPRTLVLVSIDGLGAQLLAGADAPGLARIAAEGSTARRAVTILPSRTLASHTSMLSGLLPAAHGVDWNRYQPWSSIRVPTLFTSCAQEGWRCGLFAGKRKFAHFAEEEPGVERYAHAETAEAVCAAALAYLRERQPAFELVHLAEVDLAGHEEGWGSERQRLELARIDRLVEGFLRAARAAAERPFAAIVTADHGGHAREHGSDRPEDLEIPWIAWGDGIPVGARLDAELVTVDTAATALALLGRDVPATWSGRARLP
jgi:hypothetical protein